MGTITSGVGLVSGINSSSIIDQLISLESRPKTLLQNRITANNSIKLAYTDLQARLSSLLNSANTLIRPSTFQAAKGTSSNEDVLTATVGATAQPGSYQFTVARTVSTQSMISGGYAASTAPLSAGTIHIGLGGGEVSNSPDLSDLNGGAGIRRGQFRITDKAGSSATIDLSGAVSLDDVLKKINTADNVQVTASMGENGLVITDASGGTGSIRIADLGGGFAAADLGILGTNTGDAITGADINKIGRNSSLASLNDGNGVRTKPGTDFNLKTADGSSLGVSLLGKRTVGDVIDTINRSSNGKVTASLRSDGRGLQLIDNTTGAAALSVEPVSDSLAARDLGLAGASSGNTLTGASVRADLGSVLARTLNGGSGIGSGQFQLTDHAGATASVTIDGANSSLADVIKAINNAGTGIQAKLNSAGTGISLNDASTGSGAINIQDTTGTVAGSLGIAGSRSARLTSVESGSLKRQYLSENSLLSSLNGGKGISAGKFKITAANGGQAEIDLSDIADATLDTVIQKINAKNIGGNADGTGGVRARMNADGNGLEIVDNTAGAAHLTITDSNGTAASDLRIAGTATANKLNGAYDATITVADTDTLDTLTKKINTANIGVSASIINDGSGSNPYRLSLNSTGSGLSGRFVIDSGSTGLGLDSLVKAQNAAVFLGSSTSTNPVLINSSSNTLTNVLPGVSLNLQSASSTPVTVSVTQSPDTAVTTAKGFVDTFNGLTAKLKTLTSFDTTTNAKGLLLGDATASGILDQLFRGVQGSVKGAGRYTNLSQIGITVGASNAISFDETKFRAAYAADPQSTQRLFTAFNTVTTTTVTDKTTLKDTATTATTPFGTDAAGTTSTTDSSGNAVKKVTTVEGFGMAYLLQKAINKLTDPVDGSITRQNKSLDSANTTFQDRIDSLTTLIATKKERLQKQFANMESVLAKLQTQQSSIAKITSVS